MTDRGTRVRWTTAALVAPTAAALFTGTTVWAAGHQPGTATTGSSTTPAAPAASLDPQVVALQKAIAANTAQVSALRKTVAGLAAQATAISGVAPAKAGAAAKATPGTTSRSSGSSHSTTK